MTNFDKYCSPYAGEELRERLGKIRHVAFDMDGTIYMGSTLFPFTIGTLHALRENGIGYSFLTNNPSRSIAAYLSKLAGMGIEATREEMYTTAVATVDYIRTHYPEAQATKIERDHREFDVKLNNRVELTFNKNMQLVDID